MKLLSYFVVTVSLLSAGPAMATQWVEVTSSVKGDVWFVDIDSIKDINDSFSVKARKAWIKIDYSVVKSEPARDAKVLVFFDCLNEKSKYTTWLYYKSDGTVLRDNSPSYPTYEPVIPDSVMSGVMEPVCNLDLSKIN